jgi:hypothetical protein
MKKTSLIFDEDKVLIDIVKENNLTPLDIINIIKGENQNHGGENL